MFKRTHIALVLAALSSAAAFAATSPDQAISAAEKEGQGQAVEFKLESKEGKSTYTVKIIGETSAEPLIINTEDGKIVVEKAPEEKVPAFNLHQAIAEAEKSGNVTEIKYLSGKKKAPPHAQGEKGSAPPAHADKPAQSKDGEQAVKSSEKLPPFYLITIEKDGNVDHRTLSAIDGSPVKMPKGPRDPKHAKSGERPTEAAQSKTE